MRRVIGVAAIAVLGFDVAWPLIYRAFPARRDEVAVLLTIVSLTIPFITGLLIAQHASVLMAGVGAGVIGALDSTVGWAISVKIAPGLQAGPVTLQTVVTTIVGVVLIYTVFGWLGGLIGRRYVRRRGVGGP